MISLRENQLGFFRLTTKLINKREFSLGKSEAINCTRCWLTFILADLKLYLMIRQFFSVLKVLLNMSQFLNHIENVS